MSKIRFQHWISILTLAISLTLVLAFLFSVRPDYLLWWFLTVILFPITLYGVYYFAKANRWRSFLTALINDLVCFGIPILVDYCFMGFHWRTDFESRLVMLLMVGIKMLIIAAAAIIYAIGNRRSKHA